MNEPDEPIATEDEAPVQAPRGAALIRAQLPRLPESPGVYRMTNEAGQVLYVGKARNLKRRVAAYAKLAGHSQRIARMIAETVQFEVVTTHTETEALLLEANLIKRLKPRYNISYRDDKSYPYILVRTAHAFPQIIKHRGAQGEKGRYFGPFAAAGAVTRTLNTLQRAFLLRSCSDNVFAARTRPCLLHQIKRCSAPCVGLIDEANYGALVEEAVDFLSGKGGRMREELQQAMAEASAALDFERAASLRDRIRALSVVDARQGINPASVDEADVVAVYGEGGHSCVQVFFFRSGQNWGNRAYFPRHTNEAESADVIEAFLAQFYEDKPIPRLILVSHDFSGRPLLEEALSLKLGRRVEISHPQKGEKRALVLHAETNAREALGQRMAENRSQAMLLSGLSKTFGLSETPQRIEVYDNSHIMGTNAVGAMIVAGPAGFDKSQYRKFNIKPEELTPGDDFGMMRQVLTRRFGRLLSEEGADKVPTRPDLVLIDGGAGQLSASMTVFETLGLTDIPLVAISKGPERNAGREEFHMPGRASFMLEPRDPVLYYLQRLRDEAHRFAIGTHRAKRAKAFTGSVLDEVPGIGPARKRALLHHFGSARGVERASLADLEKVEGVSKAMAQRIFDHFRGGA
jgi:excinuclease ABC subunit C